MFSTPVTTTPVSQPIQPPQPIPFIPMVPPLANTFATTLTPSVTSALVDNLINNNPTPAAQSPPASTTVTSSAFTQNVSQVIETNANAAVDNLATNVASQMFVTPSNPSSDFIRGEQNMIQPPSSIPAAYQVPPVSVNQNFVQSEGEFSSVFWRFLTNFCDFSVTQSVPPPSVPMYNMNQYSNFPTQPVAYPQQPSEAQQKLEQAFASPPMTNYTAPDPNSNQAYQQFQPASSQFSMSTMQPIPTFEAYPQVQTQISLQGLPPLTVNTPRINPTEYS
jgi:hypothetical protein